MTTNDIFYVIRQEIDALRASGAKRQELSLHACQRLFFDHGFRPSVSNVRELTRTGSASDIPKDINRFWEQIRTVARVKLKGTVLPQSLEKKASMLLSTLYEEALQHAQATFDNERHQLKTTVIQIKQTCVDIHLRQQILEKKLAQHKALSKRIQQQLIEIETQLAVTLNDLITEQNNVEKTHYHFENGPISLHQQLEIEQRKSLTLSEQIEKLHKELRETTENHDQKIKNAVTEAERRVKPMLVELDMLRNMARKYQTGLNDMQHKEFDFIQQLRRAKIHADQLTEQLQKQRDEFIFTMKEQEAPRDQNQNLSQKLATLILRLAKTGQLNSDAFNLIGTTLDQYISLPSHCPKCQTNKPKWLFSNEGYELFCSECEHTSGLKSSRFEAETCFFQAS